MQHALREDVRAAERPRVRGRGRSRRAGLPRLPRGTQPSFHVFAVEHVAEQELIFRQRASRQHERHRPRRLVIQRERLEPGQPERFFRGHRDVRFVAVVRHPARAGPVVAQRLNRQKLVDDPLAFQRAREVLVVRVGRRRGQLQRQLE
eukprot:31458-Pelagococcus_subviridis.AAC.5